MAPPLRLLDVPTADKLTTLHRRCVEGLLSLTLDFDALRPPECQWLLIVTDREDRPVLSARGPLLSFVVGDACKKFSSLFPKEFA